MTTCKTLIQEEERIPVTPDFIERNKLVLSSADVIKELLVASRTSLQPSVGGFAFAREVYSTFIPIELGENVYSEEFLESCRSGKENYGHTVDTIEEAAQDFLDYMVFSLYKVIDKRSLSAARSQEKLSAWLIAMNRPDLASIFNDLELIKDYGAPAIKKLCKEMEIEYPDNL